MNRSAAVFVVAQMFAVSEGLCAEWNLQIPSATGYVVEYLSGRPIDGAVVSMRCELSVLHQTATVREVQRTTDARGEYHFSLPDVIGCNFAHVTAEKEGYSSFPGHFSIRKIPIRIALTRTQDLIMAQLVAMAPVDRDLVSKLAPTGVPHQYNLEKDAVGSYEVWYSAFWLSKRKAGSARERKFVVSHYCETLKDLYRQLPEEAKSSAHKWRFVRPTHESGDPKDFQHDFKAEVLQFCEAPSS
jgi:hypothetical protein